MTDNEYKNCPYCDEEIKAIAVKCRHCKSMLIEGKISNGNGIDNKRDKAKNEESNMRANPKTNKVPRKKSKARTVLYVTFCIFLLSIIGFFIELFFNESTKNDLDNGLLSASLDIRGNTVGNTINFGYATQYKDWTFYVNENDMSRIYKIRADGGEHIRINDDANSSELNIVDGWVYYRRGINKGLYKITLNGKEHTQIGGDMIDCLSVVNDWIYYTNYLDGRKIYKIRSDGGERTKINDDESWFVNVVDGWIYYSNYSKNARIYKMRIDGSGHQRLNSDPSASLNVVGNWIYFINGARGEKIYKIRVDGSGQTKVNDDTSWDLNVVGDWIYYSNKDDGSKIYRIRTDGSDRNRVNDVPSYSINVVDSWIYYLNDNDHKMYWILTDGSSQPWINFDTVTGVFRSPIVSQQEDSVQQEFESTIQDVTLQNEIDPELINFEYLIGEIIVVDIDNDYILFLRDGPGFDYRETRKLTGGIRLENGTLLRILNLHEEGWLFIENLSDVYHEYYTGYLHSDYVKLHNRLDSESSLPDEPHTYDYATIVYVDVEILRLRSGPSVNFDIINRLEKGTLLHVIGAETVNSDEIWLQIVTPDGKEGWVHSDYVSEQQPL